MDIPLLILSLYSKLLPLSIYLDVAWKGPERSKNALEAAQEGQKFSLLFNQYPVSKSNYNLSQLFLFFSIHQISYCNLGNNKLLMQGLFESICISGNIWNR